MCYSFITYPRLRETEHNSPSTKFECAVNETISFEHAITLTGIKLDFENETKAELEMECINYKTTEIIKVKITFCEAIKHRGISFVIIFA